MMVHDNESEILALLTPEIMAEVADWLHFEIFQSSTPAAAPAPMSNRDLWLAIIREYKKANSCPFCQGGGVIEGGYFTFGGDGEPRDRTTTQDCPACRETAKRPPAPSTVMLTAEEIEEARAAIKKLAETLGGPDVDS